MMFRLRQTRGDARRGYSITLIDIVVQALFTIVVLLRIWKGWDFTLHVLMALALFATYMAPCFVAVWRRHPERARIGVLNTLLGWTGVGWIAVLVWSLRRDWRRSFAR